MCVIGNLPIYSGEHYSQSKPPTTNACLSKLGVRLCTTEKPTLISFVSATLSNDHPKQFQASERPGL
jgi:hypothetical protein